MPKINQMIIIRTRSINEKVTNGEVTDTIDTIDLTISLNQYKEAKFSIIDELLKTGKERMEKL